MSKSSGSSPLLLTPFRLSLKATANLRTEEKFASESIFWSKSALVSKGTTSFTSLHVESIDMAINKLFGEKATTFGSLELVNL